MQAETCQSCGATVAGQDVLYTADARLVCPNCYYKAALAPASGRGSGSAGLVTAGGLVGLVPFLFHVTESSTVIVNGETVSATSRDYIALACGVVALVLGAIAAAGGVRAKASTGRMALRIAVIALGALQIARGFGAI